MSLLLDVVLFIRKNAKPLMLSPTERVVLISLAGRIGHKKDTWIKQQNLAEECVISARHLRNILSKLVEKKLINIDTTVTKNGKQNRYQFTETFINYRNPTSASNEKTTGTGVPIEADTTGTVVPLPSGSGVPVHPTQKSPEVVVALGVAPNDPLLKETIEKNNKAKVNKKTTSPKTEISLPDFIDSQDWKAFKEFRQNETKYPLGRQGEKTAITVLTKLHESGQDVHQIITNSIMNGWRGFWPLKGEGNGKGSQHGNLTHRQATTQRAWDAIQNWR